MKALRQSFAGGEITPELYGRIDLGKNQTGLARCKNFRVLPHGPVQNRPGFSYVLEAKDSAHLVRVIPFAYSATQTMLLEFGHQYVRFHTGGATLLETGLTITGITQAAPGVLTYTGTDPANGDVMYLSGIGGMTELNGRFVKVASVNAGANTFQLTDLAGTNIDTSSFTAYTSGGTAARAYVLATPFNDTDLFDLHFTQSADVLTITHAGYQSRELRRVSATNWTLTSVSFAPTIGTPGAPTTGTGGPGGGTPVTYSYKTTAVASDGLEESLASAAATASMDLSIAGNYIDVTPAAVSGANYYNVYKLKSGVYGYIGRTTGAAFRDNNITADVTISPPETLLDWNTGAGKYPAAVAYHEQRRVFGGSTNKPQSVIMTRSGTESNTTSSIPTRDDDAIELRIVASQQNAIRHLVSLSDLIAFTVGGVFRIFSGSEEPLTPNNVRPKAQAASGAANVTPALTDGSILYVQAQGARIRELSYSWEQNRFASADVSLMAPHLFDGYTAVDMAFALSPVPTLWTVRSDGVLLGMTYVPEHQVYAWHQHDTDGLFESVAVVAEDNESVLYAVVKRTINGRTIRIIERMASRFFEEKADAFIVDCGLTYSGAAATVITNLHHLEGETVSILADGAVKPPQQVTNGRITLDTAAAKVHVGLPIAASLRTLPLAAQNMEAAGQGSVKNVAKAYVRVNETTGIRVGPSSDKLTEMRARRSEPYGTAPELRSEELALDLRGSWNSDGSIEIHVTDPVPATVLSLTLEVAAGG